MPWGFRNEKTRALLCKSSKSSKETRCLLYRPSIIHPSLPLSSQPTTIYWEPTMCCQALCWALERQQWTRKAWSLSSWTQNLMQETSQETGNCDENAQLMGGQGSLIAGSHGWQVGSEYYGLKKKELCTVSDIRVIKANKEKRNREGTLWGNTE